MINLSRREFIERMASLGLGLGLSSIIGDLVFSGDAYGANIFKGGSYYQRLEGGRVQCEICPKNCILEEGQTCFCRTRTNVGGVLYNTAWNNPSVIDLTSIERGPLYHAIPGARVLAIGASGCNLRCLYCQNAEVSQARPLDTKNYNLDSMAVVRSAGKKGCDGITFTYTEPVAFYEYMMEIARLAKAQGLLVTTASAGYINPPPLKGLCRYVDAFSITLKAFDDGFYQRVCAGGLKPVLKTMEIIKGQGRWLEVVYLVVPYLNDDMMKIKEASAWIKENLGQDTPLHLSRFVPAYRLKDLPETPITTLEMAREVALEAGLKFVYITNLPGHIGGDTYCPDCQKAVIQRAGFKTLNMRLRNGRCIFCDGEVAGLWKV